MSARTLLTTDLDGTLIPDGQAPESPQARKLFAHVVARPEVTLAYVTGRHRALVEEAIEEFDLPTPDYVVTDVGTTIHHTGRGEWEPSTTWTARMDRHWMSLSAQTLQQRLIGLPDLRPQPEDRQSRHKISFYTEPDIDQDRLRNGVLSRLGSQSSLVRVIWSVDSVNGQGLLDLIPTVGGKRAAIAFLMEEGGFTLGQTLFAGDSGNDLEVLVSPIPAVLVANASDALREQATRTSEAVGMRKNLHVAEGGFLGMNGNYAAGVLEGLAHFRPEVVADLDAADRG